MRGKILITVILVGSLVCSTVTIASAVKYGGTLVFGSSGDACRLDPADVTDGESIQRMDNIFEGLVEYKPGSTEIREKGLSSTMGRTSTQMQLYFPLPDNMIQTIHIIDTENGHIGDICSVI